MNLVSKLLAALVFVTLGSSAALALETGSPAWTTAGVTLLTGPSAAYDEAGSIDAEKRIYVERCQITWCHVRAGHVRGWMPLRYVAFGNVARGPLTGPRLNYPSGGPGTVCFYEGRNFTGASVCGGSGFVRRDLGTTSSDNVFSSVAIEGNVSVVICRERYFRSWCERIIASRSSLPGLLNNTVSSFRVY